MHSRSYFSTFQASYGLTNFLWIAVAVHQHCICRHQGHNLCMNRAYLTYIFSVQHITLYLWLGMLDSTSSLLGAMQSSSVQAYECLSRWSPDEAKAHRDRFTHPGEHRVLLELQGLHALFSLVILMIVLLVSVSSCQSCMGQTWSFSNIFP